ncbi:hypothetical protein PR001_g26132 [Phytophthora rubi]|uniref:Uncharacterized protein n=2 Tax=Phytophthora TaxID=4783 RepID=A0A6A3HVG8_9STRA|nr:hypothetical protein PR001_g26132 [Phytophthora rubi]KAE9358839.1 hypothetical protein PF008_g2510 [Phytophthora fragariae]
MKPSGMRSTDSTAKSRGSRVQPLVHRTPIRRTSQWATEWSLLQGWRDEAERRREAAVCRQGLKNQKQVQKEEEKKTGVGSRDSPRNSNGPEIEALQALSRS